MIDDRRREGTRELHVLLVESDPLELKRTGTRLLAEGCVVSTCAPNRLFDTAERLRPDLVLLDPVSPGIDLVVLLARCGPHAPPPVALHTKVLKSLLAAVLSLNDFAGVIRKTPDDRAFQEAFLAITDGLDARRAETQKARSLAPAVSGTHRIGDTRGAELGIRVARGTGSR